MGEEISYRIRLSRGEAGREHLPEGEERKEAWERVGTRDGLPCVGDVLSSRLGSYRESLGQSFKGVVRENGLLGSH